MSPKRVPDLDEVFREVVKTYGNRVYRLALRYTGVRALADDVSQEVFLRFWRQLPTFRNPRRPWRWLKRVTKNRCTSLYRHLLTVRDSEPQLSEHLDRRLAPDPETQCLSREQAIQTMTHLPDDLRSVLMLKHVEGLSGRQTAKKLGKSEPWVSVRSKRLREHLEAGGWRLYDDDE